MVAKPQTGGGGKKHPKVKYAKKSGKIAYEALTRPASGSFGQRINQATKSLPRDGQAQALRKAANQVTKMYQADAAVRKAAKQVERATKKINKKK